MRQRRVLMYHWFRPERSPSTSRSPQLELTPGLFERQMSLLERRGYRTLSLARALDGPAPPRSIVLTVDDGTRDFWEHARPVLARHGFTATLFVVTGHVGRESDWDLHLGEPPRPLMSWDQIRELQRSGYEIGSHTHSHRSFTDLDDDEIRTELALSRQALARELGVEPEFMAYPRGAYRPHHKALVREAGFRGACAVALGWRDLRSADPFELKRMTIKGTEPLGLFRLRLWLAGAVPFSAETR